MSCKEGFQNILHLWDANCSMSDMYHMILDWMQDTKPDVKFPQIANEVQDWLCRAKDGDETNDLVEEFVYGEAYAAIRTYFTDA